MTGASMPQDKTKAKAKVLGYIVLYVEPYEGMDTLGPHGTDDDPLQVFDTEEEAKSWARKRNVPEKNAIVLALDLTPEED
jgi:hypothetical protein